jgi:hypothetical protein
LSEERQVTTWVSTIDGPLDIDILSAHELLIWDSGDYRDETGLFGEDAIVIFEYLEAGGDLLVIGTSPVLLGDSELAQLADLEVTGEEPVLLNGFVPGEIIALDQVYDAVSGEALAEDSDENTVVFFLRGPASEDSGNPVGVAVDEEQKTVVMLAPFTALPAEVQERLLGNLMDWFGLSGS